MVIRGRAPLRVSFGGGGSDVAPFCEEQGGAIIGSTINKYAYCSIVPRDDDQIIVHSLDFDMTVKYHVRENYVCDGRLDLVTAALNGELANVEYEKDPIFGLAVPKTCPNVPAEVLNPRSTWADKDAYDESAKKLAALFVENFKTYHGVDADILAAGPGK